MCFSEYKHKIIWTKTCNNVIYILRLRYEVSRSHIIKDYFEDFFKQQSRKVQDKIIKVLDILETVERVPITYLKYVEGTNGLFEIRVQLGSDIFRIFCCFDGNKLVVLFSGFQKKTQKTPSKEIDRALRIMNEYYNDKNNDK